jgi:DNA (cytosine-5)-methyltransferase 1
VRLADANGLRLVTPSEPELHDAECNAESRGSFVGLANSEHAGHGRPQSNSAKPRSDESSLGLLDGGHFAPEEQSAAGPVNGFWRATDWLYCRDGKWRAVEPGTFPLVDGAASRVVRLRAYGNAINAKAAQVFIESFMAA